MSPTVTTSDLFLEIDDYFFRVIPATERIRADTNADYFFRAQGSRRLRLIYDLRNKSYTESWPPISPSYLPTPGHLALAAVLLFPATKPISTSSQKTPWRF